MNPNDNGEYAVHPAANVFPMIGNDELRELADNIKRNGLLHPVEIVNKRIVDGRNRLAACRLAGVAPQFRDLSSTLPNDDAVVRHVLAANIHRRHLTTSQRAAIAAELAALERGANQHGRKQGAPNGAPSNAGAAKLLNVSRRSVQRAKAVMKSDPAAHEAAKAGKPKPRIQKTASAPTTTKPASAPKPMPPVEVAAPPQPIRESAPLWYTKFCDRVLEIARATMREHQAHLVDLGEAFDDVLGQIEAEAKSA